MTTSLEWSDEELPPETEEEVYQTLARALRRKRGFGLYFVRSTPAKGQEVIGKLRTDLAQKTIQVLQLDRSSETVYDRVAKIYQQQPFDILFIEDLEQSLYAYEDTKRLSQWTSKEIYSYSWKGVPPILRHLNLQRERFREDFPCSFVFLVRPFVIKYFIQRAPDFFDWRSGLFEFSGDSGEVIQASQKTVLEDYSAYSKLSSSERVQKIFEIRNLLEEPCQTDEQKAELLFDLGRLFQVERNYDNAIASYDKALAIKPDNHSAWRNRGIALGRLRRYEEAIASYDKALEFKPDKVGAWFSRGLMLRRLGRDEEAIASYDKALEFKPDMVGAWHSRGLALSRLGRDEEAVASYDKALEFKPGKEVTWYRRGIALSHLGRYEEAVDSCDKALEIKFDDERIWYVRGLALYALGHYEESIDSYDKVLEFKFDDAAEVESNGSPPFFDNDKALAIKFNNADVWYARGLALYSLSRYEEVVASYDKALEFKPGMVEAWYRRGLALSHLGRYKEAIDSYDKVLAIKPDDANAWYAYGLVLYALGRYDDALTSYDKALKVKSDDADIWYAHGLTLYSLGCYEQAIASHDKALKVKPNDYAVWYSKACCYGFQGKVEEAVKNLQQAIELNLENRNRAKTDINFDPIRDDPNFQALIEEHH